MAFWLVRIGLVIEAHGIETGFRVDLVSLLKPTDGIVTNPPELYGAVLKLPWLNVEKKTDRQSREISGVNIRIER